MLSWLLGLWHARCRKLDIEILWPTCVSEAPDLETARMVFTFHALLDPAWRVLGENEMRRQISTLG